LQIVLSAPELSTGTGLIVSEEPLVPVPPGPVTEIVPDVADVGTVTVIDVDELTVNVGALVPLTVMEVTPDSPVPVIFMFDPEHADAGILVIVGFAERVTFLPELFVPQLELELRIIYSVVAAAVNVKEVLPEATTVPKFALPVLTVK
jgi:hypothetical protein